MTYEEMQAVIAQMLAVERQLQERQLQHSDYFQRLEVSLQRLEEKQDRTQSQLEALVMIVSRFVDATNTRLDKLEDK